MVCSKIFNNINRQKMIHPRSPIMAKEGYIPRGYIPQIQKKINFTGLVWENWMDV